MAQTTLDESVHALADSRREVAVLAERLQHSDSALADAKEQAAQLVRGVCGVIVVSAFESHRVPVQSTDLKSAREYSDDARGQIQRVTAELDGMRERHSHAEKQVEHLTASKDGDVASKVRW